MCENEAERHEWRASVLSFIGDHVDIKETYRLGADDLAFGELLPDKPGWLDQEEVPRANEGWISARATHEDRSRNDRRAFCPRCSLESRRSVAACRWGSGDNSQGARSSNALPLPKSRGADTWSCTMSQVPLIFRKHVVERSQCSVLFPFFIVTLIRMRPCAKATSSPTVIVEVADLGTRAGAGTSKKR